MKKILLGAIATLALSTTGIHAQTTAPVSTNQSTTETKTAKTSRKEIMDQLNLTADQKKQLEPIEKDEKAKREKINSDTSLTPEQKKAEMKSLKQESISKISKILTPDQLTKLKELKAKYKSSKGQGGDDTSNQ